MSRLSRLLFCAAFCCLPFAGAAGATPPMSADGFLLEELATAELAELRGGFMWQGLNIQLGAEVRSYLGEELVLQTNYNWTGSGAETRQMVSPILTPADADSLPPDISNGQALLLGKDGFYLAKNGQTAFLQRTDRTLQNIVLNAASNVVIRQQVDAKISIGNFQGFAAGIFTQQVATNLSRLFASIGTGR